MKFRVHVPASSANLGSGFDCIGLALPLYLTLTLEQLANGPSQIIPRGPLLAGTPANENNAVYAAMQHLANEAGQDLPPLKLTIETQIPLARGLGSSAAALIGGLVAANKLLGLPFTPLQVLYLAAREEGHPDNVAPALLGGIVIAAMGTNQAPEVPHVQLPVPDELRACLYMPDVPLSTESARQLLPDHYSRADTVHALSHAALTAAALATGNLEVLGAASQDRVHQPYRAPLVAGLSNIVQQAQQYGALSSTLSGAGPSVLCLYRRSSDIRRLRQFLEALLEAHNLQGQVLDLELDRRGTWIENLA